MEKKVENFNILILKIIMMIWKNNLNLFWLEIVIYLIKLAEIWLICKKQLL
jgi:hypothetical protein